MLDNAKIKISVCDSDQQLYASHTFSAGDPDFEYVADSLEQSLRRRRIRYERNMFPIFTLTIRPGRKDWPLLRQFFNRLLPTEDAVEITSAMAKTERSVVDIVIF